MGILTIKGENCMKRKIKGIDAGAFKFLFCAVFIILFSETAFGQVSDLILNPTTDIRLEIVFSNDTIAGYNLFIRKKPGIESVMLTEPAGNYALRSLVWNATNGNERRELSGQPLTDPNSRYSILSSSPIPDSQFGMAFKLFLPSRIIYGNSLSAGGPVLQDLLKGIQLNIRTFDHKYGDPNRGRFQNNLTRITPPAENITGASSNGSASLDPSLANADKLRRELREKIEADNFLNDLDDDDDLKKLLIYIFWEMERK